MTRRVFFSFHYERDNWRAGVVRNSNVVEGPTITEEGFIDSAEWEELKQQGDDAIESWIDDQLKNTSVTVILIGAETYDRNWVNYEIKQSINRQNGLLGVRIHRIKNQYGNTDTRGLNPLDNHQIQFEDGSTRTASSYYKTKDWVLNSGRQNMGDWIEEAAELAGR
ncbi:TIR domain-containing protein [Haladaptatus salinisoli]|uniref:TIR domain-containing protein n=1 Tax=Haladaptatus salinisoli TaxID=2884876 RepID=UPI001D0B73B9|nr:TIR domain-containing protein [Haladaptatus salinisoli]